MIIVHNILDEDYLLYEKIIKCNGIFCILIIILMGLLFIKKDYYYQNVITFVDKENAIIVVDKKMINKIKESKELIIHVMILKYNVNKIEEKEDLYLVSIHFNVELDIPNAMTYHVFLDKECIIRYILRIMKGER